MKGRPGSSKVKKVWKVNPAAKNDDSFDYLGRVAALESKKR